MSENAVRIKFHTAITAGSEFDKEIWAKIHYQMFEQVPSTENTDGFIAGITVSLQLKNSDSLTAAEFHAAAAQLSHEVLVRLASELESQQQ